MQAVAVSSAHLCCGRKSIAFSAHSFNQRIESNSRKRFAQSCHLHIHGTRFSTTRINRPHKAQQFFSRNRARAICRKRTEHFDFTRAERHGCVLTARFATSEINMIFTERNHAHISRSFRTSSKHRANSREHFTRTKRLDDIIIGAALKSINAIAFITARSHHHNRKRRADRSHLTQYLKAIAPWQHHIKQHKIRRRRKNLLHRNIPARARKWDVPAEAEHITQPCADRVVVFNDHHSGFRNSHEVIVLPRVPSKSTLESLNATAIQQSSGFNGANATGGDTNFIPFFVACVRIACFNASSSVMPVAPACLRASSTRYASRLTCSD